MCRSMADIQPATTEIRRGLKKRKERRKKKPQDKNIMSASATQGGHNNTNITPAPCDVCLCLKSVLWFCFNVFGDRLYTRLWKNILCRKYVSWLVFTHRVIIGKGKEATTATTTTTTAVEAKTTTRPEPAVLYRQQRSTCRLWSSCSMPRVTMVKHSVLSCRRGVLMFVNNWQPR